MRKERQDHGRRRTADGDMQRRRRLEFKGSAERWEDPMPRRGLREIGSLSWALPCPEACDAWRVRVPHGFEQHTALQN